MALDGANANLGAASKEWVEILERTVLQQSKDIERLQGQLNARSGQ